MANLINKLIITASGSSSLGAGSVVIFDRFMPKNLVSALNRKGYDVLNSDTDFQAVFFDNKDRISDEKFKIQDKEVKTKEEIKKWCTEDTESKKLNAESVFRIFCTAEGIKSVKGFLTKSHSEDKWIEDKDSGKVDLGFKNVFALYKDRDEFLQWINEDKKDDEKVTKDSKTSSDFSKLKNKCNDGLKKNWSELSVSSREGYHFFCRPLKKETVGEILKEAGYEEDKENTGSFNKWQGTARLSDIVKKYSEDKLIPVHDSKYKSWCEKMRAKNIGEDDDIYTEAFPFVKSVCYKEKSNS